MISSNDFNIFNNGSASSSIYKSNKVNWAWDSVNQVDTIKSESKRMYSLINELKWNEKYFDVLIDVQGAELEVLKSFDNFIDNIRSIQVESSSKEFYIGQSTVNEVHQYLLDKGFVLLNRPKNNLEYIAKVGQGDLIYGRNPNMYSVFETFQETL